MKFLFNKKFVLLGLLVILISAMVSILADEREFEDSLKKATKTLSISIVDRDDLTIQRSIDHLQSEHSRQLNLRTIDNKVFTTSGIYSGYCVLKKVAKLDYLGLQIASVESCASPQTLLKSGFASKTFFLVFCIIQLFGLIYLTVSKSTTERNLIKLIEDLESSKNVSLETQKNDLLFSKIRSLIEDRETANQIALESQLKVENEKRISDLSRKVAHDVRSPLTALNFAVASAVDLDENIRHLIMASAKRISSIANDLLDSSRELESSSSFDPLDSLELLANEFQGASQIVVAHNSAESISLKCEKVKFERTLANIFQNSIDASAKKIDVSVHAAKDGCQIVICDEGKGFHEQVLKNVGRPGLSIGKKNGNGIGLSSAYSFMRELGGSLEISNTEVGARVCLQFPT